MKNYVLGKTKKAFTLIEMMVSIGIFMLLSAVVMSNFRSVNNSLMLDSLAQKVASSVRQAQVYGVSVFEDAATTGSCGFSCGYGVYFDMATPTTYEFFIDRNDNSKRDAGETVQTFTFTSGYQISDIRRNIGIAGGDVGALPTSKFHILFKRPNPDAILTMDSTSTRWSNLAIIIRSSNGTTKKIVVWNTGQISIQ